MWTFAGGFFNEFESASDCCIREVMEETGIDISNECPVNPMTVLSSRTRDPRGWVVDCPFFIRVAKELPCVANDDAEEARWFTIEEVDKMQLAFDHILTWRYVRSHFYFTRRMGNANNW